MRRPELTRIDSATLAAKVAKCTGLLDALEAEMEGLLIALTDDERATTPRAREGFDDAARKMARAMASFPEIGAVADFEPSAVVEDLDNAKLLAPLAERSGSLAQRLADTRLTWVAEAWVPALDAYNVAKTRAKADGRVSEVVEALAPIFARPRKQQPTP